MCDEKYNLVISKLDEHIPADAKAKVSYLNLLLNKKTVSNNFKSINRLILLLKNVAQQRGLMIVILSTKDSDASLLI